MVEGIAGGTLMEYSIVIKSFMRPEKVEKNLENISRLNTKPKKTVVVDDSKNIDLKPIVDQYRDTELVKLPFDSGLSKGRNVGVENTETDYVLVLDDDTYPVNGIKNLLKILNHDDEVGGVSGIINGSTRGNDLKMIDGYVGRVKPGSEFENHDGVIYRKCNEIASPGMYRRECLEDYSWDNRFKTGGEHLDFSLSHKKLGKWRFAWTPDIYIYHDHENNNNEYEGYRSRHLLFRRAVCKKHGIKNYFTTNPNPSKSFTYRVINYTNRIFPERIMFNLMGKLFDVIK